MQVSTINAARGERCVGPCDDVPCGAPAMPRSSGTRARRSRAGRAGCPQPDARIARGPVVDGRVDHDAPASRPEPCCASTANGTRSCARRSASGRSSTGTFDANRRRRRAPGKCFPRPDDLAAPSRIPPRRRHRREMRGGIEIAENARLPMTVLAPKSRSSTGVKLKVDADARDELARDDRAELPRFRGPPWRRRDPQRAQRIGGIAVNPSRKRCTRPPLVVDADEQRGIAHCGSDRRRQAPAAGAPST